MINFSSSLSSPKGTICQNIPYFHDQKWKTRKNKKETKKYEEKKQDEKFWWIATRYKIGKNMGYFEEFFKECFEEFFEEYFDEFFKRFCLLFGLSQNYYFNNDDCSKFQLQHSGPEEIHVFLA